MAQTVSVFSGIFAPDIGGPAKFAETFMSFGKSRDIEVKVFAYSDVHEELSENQDPRVNLVQRDLPIFLRYFNMVIAIFRESKNGSHILANGCFWEIAIARHIKKFPYTAKVPGDIVWERAKNRGQTNLGIDQFQTSLNNWKLKLMRYFFSYALKHAKWVIVPSTHLGKLCIQWGVSADKIVYIKNSVVIPNLSKKNLENLESDFITVCRLVTWKGVDQIIESVAKLNATLLVVGDGPERLNLERLSHVLEAKVSFVGQVPEGEVSNLINRSSVFVLNSNFEATSYALLEAQASELIVIANEGTGSEEVIKHGESGYLCGPNSGIDLLEAMSMARVLNAENAIIRKNARESVIKEFNLNVNYEKILGLCTQ